jgi:hypothetical protein
LDEVPTKKEPLLSKCARDELPAVVEDAIWKSIVLVSPELALMVNFASGDEVPIPTLPAKYAVPVVVAPPLIVSPPVCVPSPMVEEACETKPPVKVWSADQLLAVVVPNARLKFPVAELYWMGYVEENATRAEVVENAAP